jgi:DNA-binding transcriptional LysR family regulator
VATINLTSLRVFADVVALGSFTAAAGRHGMSQPAVSFHVRQLEERFGAPLLRREGRRVTPTAAGAELLRHARGIAAAVDDAVAAMGRFDPAPAGRLRVATAATACVALLPPVLRGLRERFPALEITVTTGSSPEIMRAVEEDRADVGVLSLPVSSGALAVVPLLEDEVVLLAPAAWDLPTAVAPADLAGRAPMLFEPEGNTRGLIDRWFAAAGEPFHPETTIGSIEAIRELVALGVGGALVSRLALPPGGMPAGGRAHALLPRLRRTLVRVSRRDRPGDVAAATFGALLDRAVRDAGVLVAVDEAAGSPGHA